MKKPFQPKMDDILNQHLYTFSEGGLLRCVVVFCKATEVFLADGPYAKKVVRWQKMRLETRYSSHIRTVAVGIGKKLSVNNYGRSCFFPFCSIDWIPVKLLLNPSRF